MARIIQTISRPTPPLLRTALAVSLFSLCGLAHAGLFNDDVARAQIGQVAQENAGLRMQLKAQKQETTREIEALQAEIAMLKSRQETLAGNFTSLQQRQRDIYTDLDSRLRAMKAILAKQQNATPPAQQVVALTPAVTAAAAAADDKGAYRAAFALVKIGNYQGAIQALQDFLATYPASPYGPAAQYWLGNSQLAQQDYPDAASTFASLAQAHPDNVKAADALLNLALCKDKLGDRDSARQALQQVIDHYPVSAAATLAKRRLKHLQALNDHHRGGTLGKVPGVTPVPQPADPQDPQTPAPQPAPSTGQDS